ncbi:uncharacterized protein LOC107737659, partial [Sinocyclocheilus rhinocerous]|uniref:uncharacterized protein LOC107737659 n=1 Tax=Sinocyclocheilus rhinocerous TaxID=307959 RepID=UPI0007B990AE
MKGILLFFVLNFFMDGAFGESVSVTEGDSVTLHTALLEIQKDDVIQWRFGADGALIAQINRAANKSSTYDDVLNQRFRSRLKLDIQTGDLTVRNIRTEHSGPYEMTNSKHTLRKIFNVSVAVAAVKSVSVLVGDSVTLQTGLTEIQRDDVIRWRFEHQNSPIAENNRQTRKVFKYDDADKRFRHRLKLDYLTGSLTIKNIGTNHSGLYEVDISTSSIKHTIHKTFNVTVSGEMKTVSVMEGESVTLHTDDTEVQSNDLILWMFRDTVIAEINKTAQIFYIYNGDNGQFRDKLKLNNQTGSLTITECKTSNSGLYELNINSNRHTVHQRFIVTVNDEVNPVVVIEGGSVTLNSDTKIQTNDAILWKFGKEKSPIVKLKGETEITMYDVPDVSFRDRLNVDHQTGSLTITNITTEHAGLYKLKIIGSRKPSFKRFMVFVSENGVVVQKTPNP